MAWSHLMRVAPLLALAAGMLIGGACTGTLLHAAQTDVATLSDMLRDARVTEKVVYRGATYTVTEGRIVADPPQNVFAEKRILLLAYAKRALRIDPPFALPGTDIDAFAAGVRELADTEQAFASTDAGWVDRMIASRAYFPVDTLTHSLEAEVARRAFLASGGEADLAAYHTAASRIAPDYVREALFFALAYRWFAPDDTTYVTERQRITKENSLATFRRLQAAMRERSRSFASFSDCISGFVSHCAIDVLQYPTVDVFNTARVPIDPERYAVSRSFFNATAISSEPDVLLSDGYCQNPELPPLVGFGEHRGVPAVREAGDARFLPIATYVDVPFFKHFLDLGFSYVPSQPFSHYTCMVIPYDEGAAFATLAVRDFAAAHPLSALVADTESREALVRYESALLNGTVLDERDARAYVRTALAIEDTARQYEADLLELALIINRRSAGSGYFLERVASGEAHNIENLIERTPTRVPIDRAFFTRTAFAALSMIVIPQVAPNDLYEPFSLPRNETPFRYLTDLVADVPLADLVSAADRYHDIR